MCKAVEDYGRTLVAERNRELVETMILKGKYSAEEISELTGLSEEDVKSISEKIKANN